MGVDLQSSKLTQTCPVIFSLPRTMIQAWQGRPEFLSMWPLNMATCHWLLHAGRLPICQSFATSPLVIENAGRSVDVAASSDEEDDRSDGDVDHGALLFQMFDQNGSGFLSKDEFAEVCESLGLGPSTAAATVMAIVTTAAAAVVAVATTAAALLLSWPL